MLAATTAKKLFRPMPGARAKGLLARKAMQNMAMAEAMQVARNTPFHREDPTSKLVSRLGFRAMMYAMVIKVVRPASISVRTVVPFSLSLKKFSINAPSLSQFSKAAIGITTQVFLESS